MKPKPCWECGNDYIDIEHEDAIAYIPYAKCLSCGNTGPSARNATHYTANMQAVKNWNEAYALNTTKLAKLLAGDE